ncbi:arrestin domain-containing protein 3-like [Osmerus eperlanus]|uniref:arrestin domain-containing protein 3-like n=1 Tax=Osmerus eperlanus TaxID=29151 RepID=UPI002E0EBA97
MTGHISFDVKRVTNITSIFMSLNGKAEVRWTTRTMSRRRTRTHTHKAEIDLFTVITGNNAIGRTVLQEGAQVYPFTFQLPQGDFPSTFKGVHGRVVYFLKVEIHRSLHITKVFETEFNFSRHIDSNHPQLLAPLSGSNSHMVWGLCCASGPVEMTVHLDRKGFVPGETIKIACEFRNSSLRSATPNATLVQNQKYSALDTSVRIECKTLDSVTGEPVKSGTLQAYSEMTLTIPDTSLSISNCSIIDVNYDVLVTLSPCRS